MRGGEEAEHHKVATAGGPRFWLRPHETKFPRCPPPHSPTTHYGTACPRPPGPLPAAYQVHILQHHVMGLGLTTQPQEPHHIGMVQLPEHLKLPPEVQLLLLVPALQALHKHQGLCHPLLQALRLCQEYLSKLTFPCGYKSESASCLHPSRGSP